MSDDLISREDTKQAIRHKFKTLAERCEINEVLNSMPSVQPKEKTEINEVLNSMPSVQPKEKTGQWEIAIGYDIERTVMCDQCRRMAYEPSYYCPNCGAKMEG